MPFVVGVLRSSINELATLTDAMEEVVMVDIDNNVVACPPALKGDIGLIPPRLLNPLLNAVQLQCKDVKSKYSLWSGISGLIGGKPTTKKGEMQRWEAKNLANAFIGFMVDFLGSYRNFMVVADPGGVGRFDRAAFIDSQPSEMQPLLELVTQSQLFEVCCL